jgi:hypothetical protein
MKQLALACLAALGVASLANAGVISDARGKADQTWSAWGGQIGFHWNEDLMRNIGLSLAGSDGKLSRTDLRHHDFFSLRDTGSLDFTVQNSTLQHFTGGSLQVRGGYVLGLRDGSTIDLRNITLRARQDGSNIIDVVSGDGQAWFYSDRIMFELGDGNRTLEIRAADIRMSQALANRIGEPDAAGWEIADMTLSTGINIAGENVQPDRVCTPYPWPNVAVPDVPGQTYKGDLFMQTFSTQPVGCQSCTGPNGAQTGIAGFAPSSTLRNNINDGTRQATIPGDPLGTSTALYTGNIAWYTKFSGNHAPYNNDQHPFLIWNLYRVNSDGSIEQIGRSGVKHAFLTVNAGCADSCNDSHSLGRGCGDTYGVGNNDSTSDMGPRSEIIPATGQWGRCGSIFDPNCDGSQDGNGNSSWTQRMKVPEAKLVHTTGDGATFLFESWYVARDDINIYNSMASKSVNPQFSGSQWTLAGETNYRLGGAIDRWVDPTNPGLYARSAELSSNEGHAKVAIKATSVGGGLWRYDYAVMNFDFARAITQDAEPNLRVVSNAGFDSFSVPVPAGAIVSNLSFRNGQTGSTGAWTATTANNTVTWSANGQPTLDWGTMYSFSMTVNKPPRMPTTTPTMSSGLIPKVTLHVANTGSPAEYKVYSIVPGGSM